MINKAWPCCFSGIVIKPRREWSFETSKWAAITGRAFLDIVRAQFLRGEVIMAVRPAWLDARLTAMVAKMEGGAGDPLN